MAEHAYSMSHFNQDLTYAFQHEEDESIKIYALVADYDERVNANAMPIEIEYVQNLLGDPCFEKGYETTVARFIKRNDNITTASEGSVSVTWKSLAKLTWMAMKQTKCFQAKLTSPNTNPQLKEELDAAI